MDAMTVHALQENGIHEAQVAIETLRYFMSIQQINAMVEGCRDSEESQFFFDKIVETAELIDVMPKTYEQDGKGENAVVYLHYFRGGMDWYITEKDIGDTDQPDDHKQYQAFGIANLGYGGELGYISIKELIENNIELDLHFTPRTRKELGV